MNWNTTPATESKTGAPRPDGGVSSASGIISASNSHAAMDEQPHLIRVGKVILTNEHEGKISHAELFTMSIGEERIQLRPFKNWTQLDVHKWTMRGKLPASPAGLEIMPDHVKLTGESVFLHDTDGCAKLEKLFADWLAMELGALEFTRKAHAQPKPAVTESAPEQQPLHYHVEVDKRGQVHIHC